MENHGRIQQSNMTSHSQEQLAYGAGRHQWTTARLGSRESDDGLSEEYDANGILKNTRVSVSEYTMKGASAV